MNHVSERLIGLDIARYFAFVGMVLVNFDVVMSISYGLQSDGGFFNEFIGQLQGRASAAFVVLAGIGLGLSGLKRESGSKHHHKESHISSDFRSPQHVHL